jgi:antitoxin component YwqK of YwqJK toxin-antitoxin module
MQETTSSPENLSNNKTENMRNSFLIIPIILFYFVSYSQNVDYSQLETKKDLSGNWVLFMKGETVPFTGTAEKKYANGNLSNVDNYNKGRLNGTSILYYSSNGKISSVTNYKNGIYNGEMTCYYSDGKIRSFCNYKGGIAADTSVYWYENGKKSYEYIYGKEKNQKSFSWDTSGNLINESYYSSESYYTKLYSWYKNGQKKSEAILINGQMDSTFTVWYESGIIKETIQYMKGLWNGTWTDYDINGNIILQGEYHDDKLIKGDQMYLIVEL